MLIINSVQKFRRALRAFMIAMRSGAPISLVLSLEKCRIPYSLKTALLEVEVWGGRVLLRKGGSDAKCLDELCIQSQYDLTINILTKNRVKVDTILDLGGNIGLASLQFSSKFPNAKCIVVEPDPDNAKQARENLVNCDNVKLIEAGIWSRSGALYTSREYADGLDWAITVSDIKTENSINEIPAIGIAELIRDNEIKVIDLLKVDIEGAEGKLFEKDVAESFLPKTRVIALEIHDALVSRRQIEMMLISYGFIIFQDGELTVGINVCFFEDHRAFLPHSD